MAVYTQQYRPVTLRETDDSDAMSVRSWQDFGRNANNMKLYVTTWQLHDFVNTSKVTGTAEKYVCQWGPLPIFSPFTNIRCEMRLATSTANNVTARVYSYRTRYSGSETTGTTSFSGSQQVASVTVTGGAAATFYNVKVAIDSQLASLGGLGLPTGPEVVTWLILTGQGALTSEDGLVVTTFDAWPEPDEP